MSEPCTIGAVVTAVLQQLSLSPEEFAVEFTSRSGVPLHHNTVRLWMGSVRNPDLRHVIVLRDFFGVSPNKFFHSLRLDSLGKQ